MGGRPMPLTARQIDRRILNAIGWGLPPLEICARYQLSWQRVESVWRAHSTPPAPPAEPPQPALQAAPALQAEPAEPAKPAISPEPAGIALDIAFLSTCGVEIHSAAGGWWANGLDRDLSEDDIRRMAARKRGLKAAAGGAP